MPTQEQLADLIARVTSGEEAIKEARKELRTAVRAGVDVQVEETRLNESEAKLKRVKSAYGI